MFGETRFFNSIRDYKFYVDLPRFVLRSAYYFPSRWSLSKPSLSFGLFHLNRLGSVYEHSEVDRASYADCPLSVTVPLWKTNRCSTLGISTIVKVYDQVKTDKHNLKSSDLTEVF